MECEEGWCGELNVIQPLPAMSSTFQIFESERESQRGQHIPESGPRWCGRVHPRHVLGAAQGKMHESRLQLCNTKVFSMQPTSL